ncbi:TonB-dependent siderophore receptor [Candidatus Thalassolituus haligoni]|uniref:TonB-dependent siderophore receptor n=1 Tax=Candidatus Thalassolituus haligoni TaxID=3100113 RepID=UPI003514CE55
MLTHRPHSRPVFPLKALSLALVLTTGLSAAAQSLETTATNNPAAQQQFDLPAAPLATTLTQISVSTGTILIFDPAQLDGIRHAAVSGQYSVPDLIDLLIQGTDLMLSRNNNGALVLIPQQSPDGVFNLPKLKVQDSFARESATAPVEGYIANNTGSLGRMATRQMETARSVSVVTADLIADLAATSVEQAVGYTSGVQVAAFGQDLRFDQVSIRGYSVTTGADYRDGLRQLNTGWLAYYRTEPFGLERLEVVKGPDSVSYGQVTPGGLINRVSKRPGYDTDNTAELQIGSEQHRQGQLDISADLSEQLSYRLVALARDADSDVTGINDDSLYIAPSLLWRISDDTELTILAHHQRYETAGSPQLYQDGDQLTDFWAGDIDYDKLHQTQSALTTELTHTINDVLSLHQTLTLGSVDALNRYADASGETSGTVIERDAAEIEETMNTLALDTHLEWQYSAGATSNRLALGIDHYRINTDVDYLMGEAPAIDSAAPDYHQDFPQRSSIYQEQQRSRQTGIYLQNQMTWANHWHLAAGLRRDNLNTQTEDILYGDDTRQNDQATSGSLGLIRELDNGLAPYISYATSFTANIGSDANGNPFEPGEGRQLEAGVKYQSANQRLFAVASLFDLTETNVLTTDLNNSDFNVQTGELRTQGLELEGKLNLRNLDLTASYTYLDPEVSRSNDGYQGNQPTGTPNNMANAWGNYQFGQFEAGLGARWVGMSYADAANSWKNDAYSVVDARASWKLDQWLSGATAALNISNLADNTYTLCHDGYCYRARGRKAVASIKYRW